VYSIVEVRYMKGGSLVDFEGVAGREVSLTHRGPVFNFALYLKGHSKAFCKPLLEIYFAVLGFPKKCFYY
jgi:hypothetical protein